MRLGPMRLRFLLAGFLLLAPAAQGAETASVNDTAHFLAGMPVAADSPLAPLTKGPSWQQHARSFDATFDRAEKTQFAKVRAWSKANLTTHRQTLFYMFSGPDFLYANSFFPDATTYVMAGLEPAGAIPDLSKVPNVAVPDALRTLHTSTRSILEMSFFKTIDMKSDLHASALNGTLPLLYVFLARSGKVVKDATLVRLDENGEVLSGPAAAEAKADGAKGVKITFSSPNGPEQTLYYFSANLSNSGFKKGGLGAFCEKLGVGDGLVKSASYLLHGGDFSQVRSFLLQHTASILQDDTGVPATMFDSKWQLRPYGRYSGPISLFAERYQPRMAEIFQRQPRGQLGFGIGYRYRPSESSLLLATKQETAQAQ